MKPKHTKSVLDVPLPSVLYRNNFVSSISIAYNQLVKYVPRVLAQITKYNLVKWILMELGINYNWLLMLILIVL